MAVHPESRSEASEYSCSSCRRLRDDGWTASRATLKNGVLLTVPPVAGERDVCVLAQLQYAVAGAAIYGAKDPEAAELG
ncbi:MAG: hypothetical protein ABSE96_24125 [Terracidiphilus sp.]|jgi:hypothetical protein